jgi:hypothetical protein
LALAAAPIALFFLVRGQRDALAALGTVRWQPVALSTVAFVVAPLLQGLSFWLVLRFLTRTTPFLDAMTVWSRSYVLRYAPTGALAVAYRLSARRRLRASADQVLAAYAYEHVGALAAGATACLVLFAVAGGLPPLLPLGIAVATLVLTAAMRPGIAGRAVQALARRLGLHVSVTLDGRQLAMLVGVNALGWLGTGAAVYVLVAAVTGDAPGFIWLLGSYTAGYLVGFVAPLAPGGLGAREATLVVLLGARYGTAAALGVSLTIRVANVAGELVAVTLVHAVHAMSVVRVRLRQRAREETRGVSPTPVRA